MLSATNTQCRGLASAFAFSGGGGKSREGCGGSFAGGERPLESLVGDTAGTDGHGMPLGIDDARRLRGSGWDGDLEEMRLGRTA